MLKPFIWPHLPLRLTPTSALCYSAPPGTWKRTHWIGHLLQHNSLKPFTHLVFIWQKYTSSWSSICGARFVYFLFNFKKFIAKWSMTKKYYREEWKNAWVSKYFLRFDLLKWSSVSIYLFIYFIHRLIYLYRINTWELFIKWAPPSDC